jgi:hypothetical protein
MMTRRTVGTLVASVLVLFAASVNGAAAELQDCFREGYVCSVECDKAGLGSVGSAMCQAQCNAEEKLCLSKIAADRTPASPKYSPNASPVRARPVSAVQQSSYRR